jgi:hypothetical protein
VDDSNKSTDVVIRCYNQEFQLIMLLLLECKRYYRTPRDIIDIELQNLTYAYFYFEHDSGLAKGRESVYGAVAYRTKI